MVPENIQFASQKAEELLKLLELKKVDDSCAAVFFDIDGTVSRNDCLELLMLEIAKKDLLACTKEEIFEKTRELWKSRELDFDNYLKIVIALIPSLKFFSYDILKKIAHDAIQSHGSYYYLFSWMLLLKLKILGYHLIAVSGAPEFMIQMYLNRVGIFPSEINGSKYLFENNVFTGEVDISILKNKGDFIVNKYQNLYDLKRCIALGDTVSDASMFQKVGHSIAINPSRSLATLAKQNRWPIVLERKDLILFFPDGQVGI